MLTVTKYILLHHKRVQNQNTFTDRALKVKVSDWSIDAQF